MKKILLTLALSGLLISAAQADKAEKDWTLDMAEVTCKDMDDEEKAKIMMFWLDGYISAKEEDTELSGEWIDELGGYLEEGCEENKNAKLLEIIEEKYLAE